MQMPGIDAELLCQVPVRHRRGRFAQRFEHAQAEWMAERLELLGLVDSQYFRDRIGLGVRRAHLTGLYIRPGQRLCLGHDRGSGRSVEERICDSGTRTDEA